MCEALKSAQYHPYNNYVKNFEGDKFCGFAFNERYESFNVKFSYERIENCLCEAWLADVSFIMQLQAFSASKLFIYVISTWGALLMESLLFPPQ